MLDTIISMILEKGGLGYALFLATVFGSAKVILRGEAREAALRAQVDALQAARVAEVEKTRDDIVRRVETVNRELVETLTTNRIALDATNDVMNEVLDRLPSSADTTQKVFPHEPAPRRLPPPRR